MLFNGFPQPNSKKYTYRAGHLTWRPERVLRGSDEVGPGVEVNDAGPVGGDEGGGGGSTIGVGSVTVGGIARSLSKKAGLRRSTLTFSCLPLMSMVKTCQCGEVLEMVHGKGVAGAS